jgi:dihydrofolate reductase
MISIIAAVAKNNVIGNKNSLPWYIPEDLRRFKELTNGKTVVMGQKTFDSIVKRIGKPLPNRKNVVLTRNTGHGLPQEIIVLNNIADINTLPDKEIFIIGGGEIYRQTIDSADRLFITHIQKEVEGDVYFPHIDSNKWKVIKEEKFPDFSFVEYERKG